MTIFEQLRLLWTKTVTISTKKESFSIIRVYFRLTMAISTGNMTIFDRIFEDIIFQKRYRKTEINIAWVDTGL